jgi:hypothetical protein
MSWIQYRILGLQSGIVLTEVEFLEEDLGHRVVDFEREIWKNKG